jgi:hypothetical protein
MPFFVDPVIGDLRTGNARFGAPEVGLLVAAISQVGREVLGLAPQAIGLDVDGLSLGDIMFQKAQNLAFETLAGGRLLIGPGCVRATWPRPAVSSSTTSSLAWRGAGRAGSPSTRPTSRSKRSAGGSAGDFMADDLTPSLRDGTIVPVGLFEPGHERWGATGSSDIRARAAARGAAILADRCRRSRMTSSAARPDRRRGRPRARVGVSVSRGYALACKRLRLDGAISPGPRAPRIESARDLAGIVVHGSPRLRASQRDPGSSRAEPGREALGHSPKVVDRQLLAPEALDEADLAAPVDDGHGHDPVGRAASARTRAPRRGAGFPSRQ